MLKNQKKLFMKKLLFIIVIAIFAVSCNNNVADGPKQFITMSVPTTNQDAILDIAKHFGRYSGGNLAVGAGMILSYLSEEPDKVEENLRRFLKISQEQEIPVLIELDGINYWQAHPELWNWWMSDKTGYSPDNKMNVEWTSWSSEDAVKIGWRNWGRQHRVLPMPNLSSPEYREACFNQLKRLVPIILEWWNKLPKDKKYLLIGVQVGVEVSIGVNNWYYPNGNDLIDRPTEKDPEYGLNHETLPDRGVQSIGYAAVRTLGIADNGALTEWQVFQATDNYAETLCKLISDLGMPREKLFMHGGGWKEGETLFWVAMNRYSCPNWSFYTHAMDPRKETSAMMVLKKSEAPYWGIGEWLLFHDDIAIWKTSLNTVLSLPKLKYVQIRHWGCIKDKPQIIAVIKEIIEDNNENNLQ